VCVCDDVEFGGSVFVGERVEDSEDVECGDSSTWAGWDPSECEYSGGACEEEI